MRKHVHVLIGWNNPRIIQGFCRYAHEAHWQLDILSMMTGLVPDARTGDGVLLTNAHTPSLRKTMLRLASQIPCVLHGSNDLGIDVPTAETDECRIGELAAEHLLERGHKQLALFSRGKGEYLRRRAEGFARCARAQGIEPVILHDHSPRFDSVVDWLTAELSVLRRPLGLFAIDDILASEAIEAAHVSGWRVPEDLAVIGVGNHPAVCEYSRVPISSVVMPSEEQAYRAARMLDALMSGRPLANRHETLPPVGVITRSSSDYLAITHAQVRRAVDFIKENASDDELTLAAIAQASNASLSNLYNLFRRELHATPAEIIQRFRLAKAHDLVLRTDEKIGVIGELSGFASLRTFQRSFFNQYGAYPSQLREAKNASVRSPLTGHLGERFR
jgi:LacI family transcriptional regulator